MYRASPYICCPCRLRELLYSSSGYNSSIAWLIDCCVRPSNWPCRKLNTVLSVAFGAEVLAETGSSADHLAPSSVFELPKSTVLVILFQNKIRCKSWLTHPVSIGTWTNLPAANASTGLSCRNVPSMTGANKYRVDGLAAIVDCPARIRASLVAYRRHWSVAVPLYPQPLKRKKN